MKMHSLSGLGATQRFENKNTGQSVRLSVDGNVSKPIGDTYLNGNNNADEAVTNVFDGRIKKLAHLQQLAPEESLPEVLGPSWDHLGKLEDNVEWYQQKSNGNLNQVFVDTAKNEVSIGWQIADNGQRMRQDVVAKFDAKGNVDPKSIEESIDLENDFIVADHRFGS